MAKAPPRPSLPADLKTLSFAQLSALCSELREKIIQTVSSRGGHFASNLGTVELAIALHRVFETPADRIVWDVGHQAYPHKLLTGRDTQFSGIRHRDGPSGFLKRGESAYDAFGAGHAGTSISAALGIRLALPPERFVAAVIGDGSLTAGMAFEALQHAGALAQVGSSQARRFIIVLNDNGMSISPNVGSIAASDSTALEKLFRSFGLDYCGPIDGHDLPALCSAFERAKSSGPIVMHVKTVKGKGHPAAESDPVGWHAVAHPARAEAEPAGPSFSAVFADELIELAKADSRVVAITAAMPTGTGLEKMQRVFPEKVIDVGICEQHAVTLAAGMACEGMRPICAIYSTFLQRGFDQLVHDVCIQNLPVIFALDRGGLVGNDGETHQGVFDIAYLRSIPNLTIMSPKDDLELRGMLRFALTIAGPVAIRFPRGASVHASRRTTMEPLASGRAELLSGGRHALIIALGPLVYRALEVRSRLSAYGLSIGVINARFAKPLDVDLLRDEVPGYRLVATLEDHAVCGGFGAAVLEALNDRAVPLPAPLMRFGVPDRFIEHASVGEQETMCGMGVKEICFSVRERLLYPPLRVMA